MSWPNVGWNFNPVLQQTRNTVLKPTLLKIAPLALFGVVLTSVGFATVLSFTAPNQKINAESFQTVHLGLSRQEVAEILGGPPGDYGPGEVVGFPPRPGTISSFRMELRSEKWEQGSTIIYVLFDEQGKVSWKSLCQGCIRREEPFLEKMRRWLGWS